MDNNFNNQHDRDPFFDRDTEYYEIPPRRKGKSSKAAKALLSIVLVAAIAVGSVGGYIWATGGAEAEMDRLAASAQAALTLPAGESTTQPASRTNYTLGSTEAALTIPEIFVKASPWVVSISTEMQTQGQNPFGFYGYGGGGGTATGTGIIMTGDGYIITNHHVIEDAAAVTVTTNGGQEYEAVIVGSDETTDIAVLKIEASNLPAAEFGDSTQLVVGEPAIVIGNPLGTDLAETLTHGVISSTERQVPFSRSADGSTFYMTLLQTDAAVNPGNSGGPLLSSRGQVVGVVNSKINRDDVEGIGFAIPASTAVSIAGDLIENGTVTIRPMLGITVYSFTEGQAAAYNEQYKEQIALGSVKAREAGIVIDSVTPNSAAANGTNGGLQPGDKIIAFNGQKVSDSAELNYQKEKFRIGDTVTVTVLRDGAEVLVEITFVGGVAT